MDSESGSLESAREAALRFLDHAPRTAAEVRRRLARDGWPEEAIAAVLEGLEEAGLVDDRAFSRQWVQSRARRKGLGPARLEAELRQRGVDREAVQEALAQLDAQAALESALEAAQRRFGAMDLEDPAVRRRAGEFLRRRGHTWETIEQVFARMGANRK